MWVGWADEPIEGLCIEPEHVGVVKPRTWVMETKPEFILGQIHKTLSQNFIRCDWWFYTCVFYVTVTTESEAIALSPFLKMGLGLLSPKYQPKDAARIVA